MRRSGLWRIRSPRIDHPLQRSRHPLGRRRSRRSREVRRFSCRHSKGVFGRDHRSCVVHPSCCWRSRKHEHLGDDRDPNRHLRRAPHRRTFACDGARDGHQRPRSRATRSVGAWPPTTGATSRRGVGRGTRGRQGHPRRRVQRCERSRWFPRRVCARRRDGLRRQDPHSSVAG